MSGHFWQAKKAQRQAREMRDRAERVKSLLQQALELLGGAPVQAEKDNRDSVFGPERKKERPPPPVGYVDCDSCGKPRRCYAVGPKKICITCRRAQK